MRLPAWPAADFARWIALLCGGLIVSGTGVAGATKKTEANPANDPTTALFSGREPVPRLTIEVTTADLQKLGESSSVRDGAYRPEVTATIREGTNVFRQVAVHLKGARGSFRSVDGKPALTLHFNEHVRGQRFHGLEKISLNNSVQDSTYLCEYLGRRLMAEAGVPVPRAAHAVVSLNGRPLGLYVLLEGWNKQFLRRHFGDDSGNFYEPAYHTDLPGPFDVKSGDSPENHRALRALSAAVDAPVDRRWSELQRTLDLDRFVTDMALEILLQHWDGYCGNQNNYRVFEDRTAGRMVFFPHGLDQLFGLRRSRNELSLAPQMRGRAAGAVLETTEGLVSYYERTGWLLTNVYDVARWTAETRRMASRLRAVMDDDPEEQVRFERQIDRLLEQISFRHEEASRQLATATTPLRFVGTESVAVENWRFWRRDNSFSFGFGFRQRTSNPGYLRIGPGRYSAEGAWRTTVLLEPGRYRFDGRVNHVIGGSPVAGDLGSSIGGKTKRTRLTEASTSLAHEFVVTQRRYVDLLCESGPESGSAVEFDAVSLKLSRLDGKAATNK